jgi:hypothetical protein
MPPAEDYLHFQQAIWKQLPKRKWLAGQDRVNDCIAIVVQEWPDEQFALAESSGGDRKTVERELARQVKRHLALAYGDEDFGFIWAIILQAVLTQLIVLIFQWWKDRKENRMALLKWQQVWRSEAR